VNPDSWCISGRDLAHTGMLVGSIGTESISIHGVDLSVAWAASKAFTGCAHNTSKKQRILSRQKNGSKSRAKQRSIVARCHEKVASVRKHLWHQVSNSLVSKNQATSLCIEDLHVKGLMNHTGFRGGLFL